MHSTPTCPVCGQMLSHGKEGGICPACLLRAALGKDSMQHPDYPALAERLGARIGRYRLLEQIGEGGFGVVWMAEQDEPIRRRVALKIIKPGMDTQEVIARFEAERQALSMMDHPNIASVHDGGTTEAGLPYFVMELVRGLPITKFCDARRMPPTERLELFRKVCLAVQHAHQKGIIHRDLKPSNILVTLQDDVPVPKVIDFGIAKALEAQLTEKTLFTRFNQWLGTPAYMSPEQAGLGGLDVDTRSDIYSLGAILFELLTGHTPFDGQMLREKGYEAILRAIREEDPPKASTCLSTLPPEELQSVALHRGRTPEKLGHIIKGELDWVLLKALERDRSRRYATANALAKDLQRYGAGEPVSAAPPGFAYQAGKLIRRHWKGASVAAAITALVIAGSVITAVFGIRAKTAEQAAIQAEQAAIQSLRLERETLATAKLRQAQQCCENGEVDRGLLMFSEALAIARLAEAKPLAEACSLNLAAWLPEAHTLLHQFPHPKRVNCIAASPDGKLVASACGDGIVRLWDLETGEMSGPSLQHPAPVTVLDFDPKGASLFTGCEDGVVRQWEIPASGKPVAKREFIHAQADRGNDGWGRRGIASVSLSKDGSRLVTGGYDGWLNVWNVDDPAKSIQSRNVGGFLTWAAFDPRDDDVVAATGVNWRLDQWNWRKNQVERKSIPLGAVHWHFDFDPSGKRIVVGAMQFHSARQLDSSTGAQIRGAAMRHRDSISWVEYSPNGSSILTASADHNVRIWDAETGAPDGSILSHPRTVTCCTWLPSGDAVVTACDDGIVRVWKLARAGPMTKLRHPEGVRDVDFSPDGKMVVTSLGGNDRAEGTVWQWDAMTGEHLPWSIGMSGGCMCSVFDRAGQSVFAVPGGRTIRRYDAATGVEIGAGSQATEFLRLAVSPDGTYLVSASAWEPGVRIWSTATLEQIGTAYMQGDAQSDTHYSYHTITNDAVCFAFFAGGQSLLTGNSNGDMQLWKTATWTTIGSPKRHSSGISAIAVAPDAKMVAVGGTDHCAEIIDWESRRRVGAVMEHPGRITALAFTPDQRFLLSSAADGNARVWHVPTCMPVGPLLHHVGGVIAVKCSPNGRWAATASDDRTAKIWRLPVLEERHLEATAECLEALTGVTANGGSTVRFLTIDEWMKRKSESADLAEQLLKASVEAPPSTESKAADAPGVMQGPASEEADQFRKIQLALTQDTPEAARAVGRLYASGRDYVRIRALSALQQMKTPAARHEYRSDIMALDDFTDWTPLDWTVLKEDRSHRNLDRYAGTLTITAQNGDFYAGHTNDFENIHLIPNPTKGRDFQLTTCVTDFTPKVPWQQAALLCWNDPDHCIKLSYEMGGAGQRCLAMIFEVGGLIQNKRFVPMATAPKRLWLRLTRIGEYYGFASSEDGEIFTSHGCEAWDGGELESVGLAALAPPRDIPSAEVDVTFESFEVSTLSAPEP